MKLIFSILIILLMSFPLFANDHVIDVESLSSDKQIISLLYPENYSWVYERILLETNKLQESLGRRTFESKKQALAYIKPKKSLQSFRPIKIVSTENTNKKIWQDTNEWSSRWERKYSQWFKDNVTKDFFVKFNIATDCADAAIAFRWIFSRIHSLPAGQTLAGTGVLFTNRSFNNKWKNYRRSSVWYKDKVFMASLRYLVNNTYTHSLYRDSYPVAITPEHLSEGAYWLTISGHTGHTVLIHRQNVDGIPLSSLNSTVPKKVRSLTEGIFIPQRIEKRKEGGLVKHLWIVKKGDGLVKVKPKYMPGYSLEQYDPEFAQGEFDITVLKRIDPNFDPVKVYKNVFKSTVDFIKSRVSVVSEGNAFCKTSDCSPGTQNYEDWSTPSRDKQLQDKMNQEESLFYSFLAVSKEVAELRPKLVAQKNIKVLGELYSYAFIKQLWSKKYFNSDPRSSLQSRWALSSNGYSDAVIKKMEKYNKPLFDKIKQSKCLDERSCPKFSKKWNKEQTIFERSAIKTYLTHLLDYCDMRGQPCDQYYVENLKDNPSFRGYNFYEYVKLIFAGSFDPHSSIKDKSGLRSDLDIELYLKATYIGQSKSYLVSQDLMGSTYTLIASNEKKSFFINGKIITSAKLSNAILYQTNENKIFYYDIDIGVSKLVTELAKNEVLKRVYIHKNKVLIATSKSLKYFNMSSDGAQMIYFDELDEYAISKGSHITSSKIVDDHFYIVNGRILYILNLKSDELLRRVLPAQVKDDYFSIANISKDYLIIENISQDAYYRTLVFDRNTAELLQIMLFEQSIDWFYGSDIFRLRYSDGLGFTLNKINKSKGYSTYLDCNNCDGFISNSNLSYSKGNENHMLYWGGSKLINYDLSYKSIFQSYSDYVIEKFDDKSYYLFSKTKGSISKIKYTGFSQSRMTTLGLSPEYRIESDKNEIKLSYDVDYLISKKGDYVPFDSSLHVNFPEGASESVIEENNFIDYIELYSNYSAENSNIVRSFIDHNENYTHKGGLFNTGYFTLWLNVK